jgi:L-aminopeptidase/D-esterase-like protein
MLTDIPGIRVGHAADGSALTGCTVILCPPKTVGGCDVRGNAPGSRELALLASEKSMQEVHAVLLTGGSAFGLAAADGVMRYLEEQGIGYETPWAKVPIVPAAVIFDLYLGNSKARPDNQMGYEACMNATDPVIRQGNVGAGMGATVGKWAGMEYWMKGGVGTASVLAGNVIVGALTVVNAVGDIMDERGNILAGARLASGEFLAACDLTRRFVQTPLLIAENTTLVVVATNAQLNKVDVNRVAQRAHDGMARAIVPVHTIHDGDIAFALATGQVPAPVDLVAEIGAEVTAQAIRNAVKFAKPLPGVPACNM